LQRFSTENANLGATLLLPAALQFFRLSNYIEAALWTLIALIFAAFAIQLKRARRGHLITAAITFLLFGISDIVEASTGAWYRPVWLLIWKGGCLAIFAWLLIGYVRRQRSDPRNAATRDEI
jgi:hypothetical protein